MDGKQTGRLASAMYTMLWLFNYRTDALMNGKKSRRRLSGPQAIEKMESRATERKL